MRARTLVIVAAVWVASLFAAGKVATAQARSFQPLPEPKVLSGADVGFRIEGTIGDMPAGTLVIRVNGQWVAPKLAPDRLALPIATSTRH
jgi:hypothetical protein